MKVFPSPEDDNDDPSEGREGREGRTGHASGGPETTLVPPDPTTRRGREEIERERVALERAKYSRFLPKHATYVHQSNIIVYLSVSISVSIIDSQCSTLILSFF